MNIFIFLFYFYFFLISFVGYSFGFSSIISVRFKSVNKGLICFLGFFIITLFSYISIFFIKHGFFHNFIIHIIGIILFFIFVKKKVLDRYNEFDWKTNDLFNCKQKLFIEHNEHFELIFNLFFYK